MSLSLLNQNKEGTPHALLFSGGSDSQRTDAIFDLVEKILGSKNESHPDFLLLPQSDKENINIDDVRFAIQHLNQSAHQGGARIVALLKADSMPVGACNALLKTLEEPLPNRYLFLVSEYPHLLPATLRSRCQKIYFSTNKKNSKKWVPELKNTLYDLKQKSISVFEAAETWQKQPLLDVLDGLYYCIIEERLFTGPNFFQWIDHLNLLRRKVLNKSNPNHLIALETLFYQWKCFA